MKNKGFTLVELLAVIVVLAIIALITIPTISGVVNKARLNSLKDSAYGLIDASNLYYAQFGVSSNTRFDKSDNENTLKELRYKGNVKEGTVIINTKGKVVVCITDGKNSAYKNYNESSVTLVSEKRCSVPENTNIVYLDGTATLTELSNQELTEQLQNALTRISELEEKVKSGTSLDKVYPVGSYYISDNNTNPANLFGGTWEKIEDKFLLASGTNTLGTTGGSSSVSYTPSGTVGNHTLTVNEMPRHEHPVWTNINSGSNRNYTSITPPSNGDGVSFWRTGKTDPVGGSQPHSHSFTGKTSNINTMPPYLVVNVWKRTA